MKKRKNWTLKPGAWTLKKSGFSLIEVVFAMFFLIVIIMGVINLQSSNLALINSQNNEIQAHLLANEALGIAEIAKANIFSTIPQTGDYHIATLGPSYSVNRHDVVNNGHTGLPNPVHSEYSWKLSVETGNPVLTNGLLVTAKIYWEDSTGNHEISAQRTIF